MSTSEETLKQNIKFNFSLSPEEKYFFDRLIYTHVVKGNLHYSLKSAFLEGVTLLQDKNPEIPKRLSSVRRVNKRGRSSSNSKGYLTSIITSFAINDWILDYIYHKLSIDTYYTTSLFVNEIIELLNDNYKGKLLKIPKIKL